MKIMTKMLKIQKKLKCVKCFKFDCCLINHFFITFLKVALKRQQAAEDAIALCMAKVTTGQKINRLPPGKIFGMTVTDPDTNKNKEGNPANSETSLSTDKNHPKDTSDSTEKEDHIFELKNQVI